MSNGAGNPYLVETGVPGFTGLYKSVKKAVVGKTAFELQEQVDELKQQRTELVAAGKEAVIDMRSLAQTLQAKIDQTTNPRARV